MKYKKKLTKKIKKKSILYIIFIGENHILNTYLYNKKNPFKLKISDYLKDNLKTFQNKVIYMEGIRKDYRIYKGLETSNSSVLIKLIHAYCKVNEYNDIFSYNYIKFIENTYPLLYTEIKYLNFTNKIKYLLDVFKQNEFLYKNINIEEIINNKDLKLEIRNNLMINKIEKSLPKKKPNYIFISTGKSHLTNDFITSIINVIKKKYKKIEYKYKILYLYKDKNYTFNNKFYIKKKIKKYMKVF